MSISIILTPQPKGSGAIFSNWALGSAGLFLMGSCSLAGTHGFPGPQRSTFPFNMDLHPNRSCEEPAQLQDNPVPGTAQSTGGTSSNHILPTAFKAAPLILIPFAGEETEAQKG